MKLRALALAFWTLFLMADMVWAGQYSCPNSSNPLFSVNIPDTWKVEPDDQVLHASPPDESLYLGFWAVEDLDGDALGEAVGSIVDEVVKAFEITEQDELEINGVKFHYFEGSGRDPDDGSTLKASVALFSPDGQTFCVVLYFGSPEAESKHEQSLIGILQSIQSGRR